MSKSYQYQPTTGPLTGISFELQTLQFLADAASRAEWGNVENRPDVENLLSGVNQQLSSLDARTTATEQALATAQSSVAANTQAIGVLQQGAALARADIDALKSRVDATDNAALAFQERVGKAENDITAAQTSLAALQAQADTTDASLNASQSDIKNLQVRADTNEQSLQEAHADVARAAQAAVKAQSAADAAQHTADAAQAAITALLPLVLTQGIIALCNEVPAGWVLCDGENGTPDLGGYAAGPLRYIQFCGPPQQPGDPTQDPLDPPAQG